MQRYKVVVVCCTADETDVHTIRVNGWGESEAEYGSKEGEQALDREFGLNMECLSLPAEAAQAMLTAEIIRKTKKYEPRAEVLEVEYETSHSQQGRIRPKVVVQIV